MKSGIVAGEKKDSRAQSQNIQTPNAGPKFCGRNLLLTNEIFDGTSVRGSKPDGKFGQVDANPSWWVYNQDLLWPATGHNPKPAITIRVPEKLQPQAALLKARLLEWRREQKMQFLKIFTADTMSNITFSIPTGIVLDLITGLNLAGIISSRTSGSLTNFFTGGAFGWWREFTYRWMKGLYGTWKDLTRPVRRWIHKEAQKLAAHLRSAPAPSQDELHANWVKADKEAKPWRRVLISDLVAFDTFQTIVYAAVVAVASRLSEGQVNVQKIKHGVEVILLASPILGPGMGWFMDRFREWFKIEPASESVYRRQIRNLYEKCTPAYDRHMEETGHYAAQQKLYNLVKKYVGEPVLDLACGPGFLLGLLAGDFERIYGNDFSKPMLDAAERRAPKAVLTRENAEDFVGGLHAHYGTIFCCNLFYYLQNREKTIQHWESLLAPGGRMIFFEEEPFVQPSGEKLGAYLYQMAALTKPVPMDELVRLVEKAGLEVVERHSVPIDEKHRLHAVVAASRRDFDIE
ncbi:L-alanine exporter AlaE [uncultured archaeon]|nr:L-alanine exporter AlaE [uncultured archaeon]